MNRVSFNYAKSQYKGKGKTLAVMCLCFAMLFVYPALLTSANNTGWISDGADLIGNGSAGDIFGMSRAGTDGTSRTFTDLVQAARSAGEKILSSALCHGTKPGFLSVESDNAIFWGELASLIQNWGYNSMDTDWPLVPLGLSEPMQLRHDYMGKYLGNSSALLGWRFSSLIADLQTVTISIVPKPLLNTVPIWGTLTLHLGAECLSMARNYDAPTTEGL